MNITRQEVESRLKILRTDRVYPHESIRPSHVYSIQASMNMIDPRLGFRLSPLPILVAPIDKQTKEFVVLDGMHRYEAMKNLNLPHIFAFVVDYESVELGGWDILIDKRLEMNYEDITKKTKEDFEALSKGEIASGEIKWENIKLDEKDHGNLKSKLKEFQQKVDNGEFPFAIAIKEQNNNAVRVVLPVKDNNLRFGLTDKIQLQKDLDEAIAESLGGEDPLSYVSPEVSIEDFLSQDSVEAILFRVRFKKKEIKEAAKKAKENSGYLLPKKTTRHTFPVRPLVQISLDILEDPFLSEAEKQKKMIEFLRKNYASPRLYEEPVYNYGDVLTIYDRSKSYISPHLAKKEKERLLGNPRVRHFAKEWRPPTNLTVFLPGPVGLTNTDASGVFWKSYAVGHRSKEFEELYNMTSLASKWLMFSDSDPSYRNYEMYIIPAPASHSMAIAAVSSVKPNHSILHIVTGSFGKRWHKISEDYGQKSFAFEMQPGKSFSKDEIDRLKEILISSGGEFDAVSLIYNETSTGTYYDLEKIYAAIKEAEEKLEKDILFIVDVVSAFGGMEIKGIQYADFIVAGVEKCLALPPGISLLAANQAAISQAQKVELLLGRHVGYTTSLSRIREYHLKNQTLGTPPIPQIAMLLKSIQQISGYISLDGRLVKGETKEKRYARYANLSKICRSWVKEIGFKLLPEDEKYASPTITAFYTGPFNADEITNKMLKEHNIMLSAGHRDLKDGFGRKLNVIRIPHMGAQTEDILVSLLERLTRTIENQLKTLKDSDAKMWKDRCFNAIKYLKNFG